MQSKDIANHVVEGVSELSFSQSPPVQSSFDAHFSTSPFSPLLSTSPTNLNFYERQKQQSLRHAHHSKVLKPFARSDFKILLLENVAASGFTLLEQQGYEIELHKKSFSEDELIEKIKDVQAIGIRSKTQLTERVLKEATNLVVIGCFCIGTNQVDLEYAAKRGIAVFNSPFSNSRSVAELVISQVIALSRQYVQRTTEMLRGEWNKMSTKCWEVRGKTLGIVGYGHIGTQLSVLSESLGMKVIYHDIVPIMSLGTATQVPSLEHLLRSADFVTLHVPELPETKNMIGAKELMMMKHGSYLINASRGTVVDIPSLIDAMRAGKLAGASLDVYPNEPSDNGPFFNNDLSPWVETLRGLKNIILTPHIGGSTEEAQSMIGLEVADFLIKYINQGSTIGAVNFPEVALRELTLEEENRIRILYVHQNVPGVLRTVNEILSPYNIEKQFTDSRGDIAYLMADANILELSSIQKLYDSLCKTPFNLLTRSKFRPAKRRRHPPHAQR